MTNILGGKQRKRRTKVVKFEKKKPLPHEWMLPLPKDTIPQYHWPHVLCSRRHYFLPTFQNRQFGKSGPLIKNCAYKECCKWYMDGVQETDMTCVKDLLIQECAKYFCQGYCPDNDKHNQPSRLYLFKWLSVEVNVTVKHEKQPCHDSTLHRYYFG